MGFTDIKKRAIENLLAGNFQHVIRNEIDDKNHLVGSKITLEHVIAVLKQCRGQDHSQSPHHQDPDITVHVITSNGWYIKFYFDPDLMFISIHPIER